MRIAFIDSKLTLKEGGGLASQLDLQARGLILLGHEVLVIVLNKSSDEYPDSLPYRIIHEKVNTIRFGNSLNIALLWILHKYEKDVDAFYLNRTWLSLGGALYRTLGGKTPVVLNLNSFHFCSNRALMDMTCCMNCGIIRNFQHRPSNFVNKSLLLPLRVLKRGLEVLTANRIDAFVPVTEGMGEVYSRRHYSKDKMTAVIPPVDFEYHRSTRQNNECKPLSKGLYNILYVGRLAREKGVDILIHAIPSLDFPVALHIVGDGPERDDLEKLAEGLGVSDRVVFHGWVPNEKIFSFYLGSQLFVHPARWPELFCLTQTEAMALDIPMIVSDGGGLGPEFDGIALTFKRADVNDLVDKIKLMHDDTELAARLVEKAREKVEGFDYKKLALAHAGVFERVVNLGKA